VSAWPTFDVAEIAEEASERAGVEFRSGYSLRTARRSLELMSIEWANRGLNLWTVEGPIRVALVPGIRQYTLPEDTVDLVEHVLRQPNPGTTDPDDGQDYPLDRWSFSDYSAIPNKVAQGRPSIIHIRRAIKPFFLIWMAPPAAPAYEVVYWRMRRMRSVGAGGAGTPDIPWRFIPAMTAGLAYNLALKSKDPDALQRVATLKQDYEEQFGLAADEDRDRAPIRWVPGGGYEVI